nr:unnamed protein product [Callosobruchus analis]
MLAGESYGGEQFTVNVPVELCSFSNTSLQFLRLPQKQKKSAVNTVPGKKITTTMSMGMKPSASTVNCGQQSWSSPSGSPSPPPPPLPPSAAQARLCCTVVSINIKAACLFKQSTLPVDSSCSSVFNSVHHKGGGVGIWAHESLSVSKLELSDYCIEQHFEICGALWRVNPELKVCILTLYRSPGGTVT